MKKPFKYIYSSIFGCMLLVPVVLFPFMKNDEELEKKKLADFPSLIADSGVNTDFSSEFDAYVNDNLPL